MSHVDEGTLHAYLDGALDSLPAAEADRVRSHLAACDVCQARLEEERAVRDEAAAILGGVPLDLGDLPTFEETRARARGTPAPAGFRMQKLAWAASMVLALGTGWMLRGGVPTTVDAVAPAREGAARAAGPATTASPDAATAMDALAPSALSQAEEESADASGRGAAPSNEPVARERGVASRGDDAVTTAATADPDAQVAQGVMADAAVGATRDSARLELDASVAGEVRAADRRQAVQEKTVVPLQPAVSEQVALRRSMAPAAQEARGAVSPATSFLPVGGGLGAPDGASLVVPGLPVVAVTWLDEPELSGAVRVLQLMEGGDTLELVHLPVGVDPALLPAVGDGRTQVLSPREGGWLVLRARAAADVLSTLLRRLEGGD